MKAREKKITSFTGIDSVYEPPTNPELIVDTATKSVEQCVHRVLEYLYDQVCILYIRLSSCYPFIFPENYT